MWEVHRQTYGASYTVSSKVAQEGRQPERTTSGPHAGVCGSVKGIRELTMRTEYEFCAINHELHTVATAPNLICWPLRRRAKANLSSTSLDPTSAL